MKKSEAIQQLKTTIDDAKFLDSQETAELVLEKMLELGMLPPCGRCEKDINCDYYCQGAGEWEKDD